MPAGSSAFWGSEAMTHEFFSQELLGNNLVDLGTHCESSLCHPDLNRPDYYLYWGSVFANKPKTPIQLKQNCELYWSSFSWHSVEVKTLFLLSSLWRWSYVSFKKISLPKLKSCIDVLLHCNIDFKMIIFSW